MTTEQKIIRAKVGVLELMGSKHLLLAVSVYGTAV
jgi:hypothetical protein